MDKLLPVHNELIVQLEDEWWGDYASHIYSYPFKDWIRWKYNARLIRPPSDGAIFDLQFDTDEDFVRFKLKWL